MRAGCNTTVCVTAIVLSCAEAPRYQGQLAPTLDSILPNVKSLTCGPLMGTREFGLVPGCAGKVGDTTAYYYADSGLRVILVGKEWPIRTEDAAHVFARLQSGITTLHGNGTACPPDTAAFWSVRMQYWTLMGYHVALLSMTPTLKEATPAASQIRLVSRLGAPDCGDFYPVPRPM